MPVTRLLAIGDIHLGRQSSRLPEGLDAVALGPVGALRRAAATAIAHDVQAVLLAGDIADSTRDQYHALGILTEILSPLGERGIEVLAVAGNHDHQVLPRLARAVPGLRVLGQDGRWEHVTLDGPGGPVRVLGWSFPAEHHPHSPAASLERLGDGPPTVGLLHADLEATTSRYAPVRRSELARAGPCRWLLGHVHAPSLDPVGHEPGYLGSLVGLDPTETGPRGPWLVEIEGSVLSVRHLPLAPLRWEALDLPVDDVAVPRDEMPALVHDTLRAFALERGAELQETAALGVRLRLCGRAADLGALAAAVAELRREPPVLEIAPGCRGFVDRIDSEVQPVHDLAALAERDDPPGLLARDLLALRDGAAADLLREAHRQVQQVDGTSSYRALVFDAPPAADQSALAQALLAAGYQILDDLLRGREGADGAA